MQTIDQRLAGRRRRTDRLGVRSHRSRRQRQATFPSTGGLRLYRLDFFTILRALMYAMIVLLAGLSMLAFADLLGADIFA